jgi:hypothetical protein
MVVPNPFTVIINFIVTVKGSEKNDPNLRNGILGKCVTPFIL